MKKLHSFITSFNKTSNIIVIQEIVHIKHQSYVCVTNGNMSIYINMTDRRNG